jgi:uncharacterized Zn finger protein
MARWRRDDYYPYYPPSSPRAVMGGIKAQSKRGGFGESWWAKRWVAVLESFQIGARLGRGRSYARSGQVLAVDVQKGRVTAQVQGSRPKPYAVTLQVKLLTKAQWKKLAGVLGREALFAAKLLVGEMPKDIERAFEAAGLSLFPERAGDLKTDCSCPDWSNPCKHIAAVYYLLGEEFDRDPFLIFRLRGLGRDELAGMLGGAAGSATETGPVAVETGAAEVLQTNPEDFWTGGRVDEELIGPVDAPLVSAALLRRLGGFPFWRGEEPFLDALEPLYRAAAARGVEVFAGRGDAERSLPGRALPR